MKDMKLIGIVQDWGIPFILLYVDQETNELFVSIHLSMEEKPVGPYVFTSLLVPVTKEDMLRYFDGAIGMTSMIDKSPRCYIWTRKQNHRGRFKICKQVEIPAELADDDFYDADFCHQEHLIKYRLQSVADNSSGAHTCNVRVRYHNESQYTHSQSR
jgi:hypothetical protein